MINRFRIFSILLLVVFSFVTCNNDIVTPREYPRVKTMDVSSISEKGATFNAEIIHSGNGKITEYGFVWGSKNPTINYSEKKILAKDITVGSFSAEITTTLREGITYYMRAYAKSDEYLVYGKNVLFKSLGSGAPEILGFSPKEGVIGDTISLLGKNFSYLLNKNTVRFNSVRATALNIENSDSTMHILVPVEIDSLYSFLTIEVASNKSNTTSDHFILKKIGFTDISPSAGLAGDTIVISGNNFGYRREAISVFFGEINANIIVANNTQIKLIVPYLKGVSTSFINVNIGIQSLNPIKFDYLVPKLISFSPQEVTWGDTVNVEIDNLHSDIDFQIFIDNIEISLVSNDSEKPKFIIPDYMYKPEFELKFKIGGFDYLFNEKILLKRPEIISIEPSIISFGDMVTINGRYFHPTKNYFDIHYTDNHSTPSVERIKINNGTTKKLEFNFPNLSKIRGSEGGDNILEYTLKVNNQTFDLNGSLMLKIPNIDSFSPTVINNIGEQIIIKGGGFDPNTTVKYNSIPLDILDVSENQITVSLPTNFVENTKIGFKLEEPLIVTNGNKMEAFSPQNLLFDNAQPWSEIDPDNVLNLSNRKYFEAWENQGKGYILGGVSNDFNGVDFSEYFDDLWELDPINDTWKKLASIPTAYGGQSKRLTFGGGDYSYLILGRTIDNISMLKYNHSTNVWEALNTPPQQIVNTSLDLLNYFSINNRHFILTKSAKILYEYFPDTDQWIEVTSTPSSSSSFYKYPYNGKEVVNFTTNDYEFDPLTSTFSLIGPYNSAFTSGYINKIVENNNEYYAYYSSFSSIYKFNPINGTFTLKTEFPNKSVTSSYCFSLNNIHYFLNGSQILGYDPNF